jgi:toxin ParE1/3/4
MSRYRLAAPAREDLAEIWESIAEQSGDAGTADRAVDEIVERLMMLAHNPRAGRLRDEIDPGVRSFPAGAYIVYYRLGKGGRVSPSRQPRSSGSLWRGGLRGRDGGNVGIHR